CERRAKERTPTTAKPFRAITCDIQWRFGTPRETAQICNHSDCGRDRTDVRRTRDSAAGANYPQQGPSTSGVAMYLTLAELLQPLPLGSLVALVMWGAAYRRHHAWRRVLLTLFIPWGVVMVSCTPAAAYLAAGAFEWWYRPLHHPPSEA